MIDHCTCFPERWPRWKLWKDWNWREFWKLWEVIYIGNCCKIHDDTESYRPFKDCLDKERVVLGWGIAVGGTLGIWRLKVIRKWEELYEWFDNMRTR